MSAATGQRTIVVPDIDWVEISGGEFVYQDGERRELPPFFMARYPVTNAQYKTFIDAGGDEKKEKKARWEVWKSDSGGDWWRDLEQPKLEASRWPQANRPRTNVDWYEALAFSRWLSAQLGYEVRLPTEDEWERAARWRDGHEYPWRERYETGYANVNEKRTEAGEWDLSQTTAVGVYPQGASTEGVLDLAGNVREWCLNRYEAPEEIGADTSGERRVVRGGSWLNYPDNARGAQRDWLDPDDRDDFSGFRLVSSAPIA